jgi:hypothetical protein
MSLTYNDEKLFNSAPTQFNVNYRSSRYFGQFQKSFDHSSNRDFQSRDIYFQKVHKTLPLLEQILRTSNFDNLMNLIT